MNRYAPLRAGFSFALAMMMFVVARVGVLILAYFGSAIAPVSFIDASPITLLDVFPAQYWAWQPGYWLTPGHLILMLSWPLIMVSGRMLGRANAALISLIAWSIVGAALGYVLVKFGPLFTVSPLPPDEITAVFVLVMIVVEFLAWRGFVGFSPGPADAVTGAIVYSILFNALTYWLDPQQALPRLVVQTLIFGLGTIIIAYPLSLVVRQRIAR
jgi:hypothetical protein